MKNFAKSALFDVSKGNHPILFILSLPFVALTWALWLAYASIATLACLIGRRSALNAIYKTKELL